MTVGGRGAAPARRVVCVSVSEPSGGGSGGGGGGWGAADPPPPPPPPQTASDIRNRTSSTARPFHSSHRAVT